MYQRIAAQSKPCRPPSSVVEYTIPIHHSLDIVRSSVQSGRGSNCFFAMRRDFLIFGSRPAFCTCTDRPHRGTTGETVHGRRIDSEQILETVSKGMSRRHSLTSPHGPVHVAHVGRPCFLPLLCYTARQSSSFSGPQSMIRRTPYEVALHSHVLGGC